MTAYPTHAPFDTILSGPFKILLGFFICIRITDAFVWISRISSIVHFFVSYMSLLILFIIITIILILSDLFFNLAARNGEVR